MSAYDELTELVQWIKGEAGFVLTHDAYGRLDLNDWEHSARPADCVRALHNIRATTPEEVADLVLNPVEHIQRDRIGASVGRPACFWEGSPFEAAVYGMLPKMRKKVTQTRVLDLPPAPTGLLSRMRSNREPAPVEIRIEPIVEYFDEGKQELQNVVECEDESDAYFIRMTLHTEPSAIPSRYSDPSARDITDFPMLTIVTYQQMLQETVSHLRKYPNHYHSLARRLLNSSKGFPQKFPNVRKGILEKTKPAYMIYLVNVSTCPPFKPAGGEWMFRLTRNYYDDDDAIEKFDRRLELDESPVSPVKVEYLE